VPPCRPRHGGSLSSSRYRTRSRLPPRSRRTWRAPATAVFCLGLVAGLAVAAYLQRQVNEASVNLPPQQQVVCDATPAGPGYMYKEANSNPPSCTNGAVPRVLP
jgi:hypothetical protein